MQTSLANLFRAGVVMCCALLLLGLGGCAGLPGKRPVKVATPAETPRRRIGTVAVVNEEQHFVLIDTGSLYHPAPGKALKTRRLGAETGSITVSPEYRRPFSAADVTEGTPAVGDDVME